MSRKYLFALSLLLTAALASCSPSQPASTNVPTVGVTATASVVNLSTEISATSAPLTYAWRGTTLTIAAMMPTEPSSASVYLVRPASAPSVESATELADQFKMQGQVYATSTNGFLVVDGNRRLQVREDGSFTYYPNYPAWREPTTQLEIAIAKTAIADFLQSYGFDFEYQVQFSSLYGDYYALPLSTDGFPLHFDYFKASGLLFEFNQDGIISVDSTLIQYDPVSSGYGIITAQEALEKILDPNPIYGTLEGGHSPTGYVQAWNRVYPTDQTVTIYGYMGSIKSAEGGEPLVTLDQYAVTGNTTGISESMPDTFVQATGQFHRQGSMDVFVLESWNPWTNGDEGLLGRLERKGDLVVLTTDDNRELILPDVPADVPLPLDGVYVMGVTRSNLFEWNSFDLRMVQGGGGGGGGGMGLYSLNLTGTPMPIPTLASPQSGNPAIGETLVGQRGMIYVNLYNQPDGSQRAEYILSYIPEVSQFANTIVLQGEGLQALQAYQNRPIDVWGSVNGYDTNGNPILQVERFEIPFPDLKIQIYRGTQQNAEVENLPATLFTTDEGQTYVQLSPDGAIHTMILGLVGDDLQLEGLVIPGETRGGYPTIRFFSGSMAISPKNGQPMEMAVTADQPTVMDEPPPPEAQPAYIPPSATIDQIEMVYFMPDPRSNSNPNNAPVYIQPMWRFSGHYSDGNVFEIFVQALEPEFLSPQIQAIEAPG